MGNPITDNLPDAVDGLLQDVAQIHGRLSYFDVIRFSKVCTRDDLNKLQKIAKFFNDREGDVTKKQIHRYSEQSVKIVHERLNKNKQSVPVKIAVDSNEKKLKIGDVVMADVDLYDLSGSKVPRINAREPLKIDKITGDMLTFTTVSDYYDFDSSNFEKIASGVSLETVQKAAKHCEGKLNYRSCIKKIIKKFRE